MALVLLILCHLLCPQSRSSFCHSGHSVDAWFCQTEAQFILQSISAEDTKYLYVVTALNSDMAVGVAPLLDSLHTFLEYSFLKSLLLDSYGLSEDKCTQQFFDLTNLADRGPSGVMD